MSRDDELRRLAQQVAQARADARYLLERAREAAQADVVKARRRVDDTLDAERRRIRDAFRKELEAVRNEIHALSSDAGTALAPWTDPSWGSLDASAARPAQAGGTALAIGEITCIPYDTSEDTLRVPATLVPDQSGAVVITASRTALERVRGALLGWCVRLLAHAGPKAVSIVWFDKGATELPIPDAWRPAGDEPSVIETYHREALARAERGGSHVVPAFGAAPSSTAPIRTVLVAIGGDAERVPELGSWLATATAVAERRVHVLLAPTRAPRDVKADVVVLEHIDDRGRMRASNALLGAHELSLQGAPSEEVVRRVAAWAVPFGPFQFSADDAVHDAGAPPAPSRPEPSEPATRGASPGATRPTEPAARAGPDAGARQAAVLDAAYLRELLGSAPPDVPHLTIAVDAHGAPVRVPLHKSVLVTGVDLTAAAAMVATHLVEVACQAPTTALEFAVLDTSDDPAVADRIDSVIDHVPHLIDVSQGIGALMACDAILERLAGASRGDPTLMLFVIATSPLTERLAAALTRILRDGAKARVMTCVWAPDDAIDAHVPPDATRLRLHERGATLHVAGAPDIEATLPGALTASDVEAVADTLRRSRT